MRWRLPCCMPVRSARAGLSVNSSGACSASTSICTATSCCPRRLHQQPRLSAWLLSIGQGKVSQLEHGILSDMLPAAGCGISHPWAAEYAILGLQMVHNILAVTKNNNNNYNCTPFLQEARCVCRHAAGKGCCKDLGL